MFKAILGEARRRIHWTNVSRKTKVLARQLQPGGLQANTHNPLKSAPHSARTLTVLEFGALSDFDDVTVRIADVTAYLAVLRYRRRDEFGSPTFP